MLQVVEVFENGLLQGDALIGVGVVGGEVDGGEVCGPCFAERGYEGVVGGGEDCYAGSGGEG